MDAATAERLSKPYWDGARQGKLVLQRCGQCGKIRHYPRVLCDACYSFNVEPVEAAGTGRVHSWTVAHHAFHPSVAEETPYHVVTVELDEGVRVLGRIDDPSDLHLGLPMRVGFRPGRDGDPIPAFTPQRSSP